MTTEFKYIAYTQHITTQCTGQLTKRACVEGGGGGGEGGAIELSTVFITL